MVLPPVIKTPDIPALLAARGINETQGDSGELLAWIESIDQVGMMEIRYNKPVIPVQNISLITIEDFKMELRQNSDEVDQT